MNTNRVIFFTGAGISVESGIPTFQEQPGIRDKLHRSFATEHPEEYRDTIRKMVDSCERAEPNAAHLAIAKLGCPVITMNVDGLHRKAGSKNVIEVHGILPTREQLEAERFPFEYDGIVLYGDKAPRYNDAIDLVETLEYGSSVFVIVGTSFYTGISDTLRLAAKYAGAEIIIINDNAATKVPELCKKLKKLMKNK
ncbi:MAG: transcriptional regulator [Clostridia bacterium]|nr:transcriptional regulator [Clostridia bacterium]